jgi:hypothetical protein
MGGISARSSDRRHINPTTHRQHLRHLPTGRISSSRFKSASAKSAAASSTSSDDSPVTLGGRGASTWNLLQHSMLLTAFRSIILLTFQHQESRNGWRSSYWRCVLEKCSRVSSNTICSSIIVPLPRFPLSYNPRLPIKPPSASPSWAAVVVPS